MATIYAKIVLLFALIFSSFFSEASDETVQYIDLNNYPDTFCRTDISRDECLNRVALYVAQKHIKANNEYYEKIVGEKSKELFREHVNNPNEKYDPAKKQKINEQVVKALIVQISDLWKKTGILPVVK